MWGLRIPVMAGDAARSAQSAGQEGGQQVVRGAALVWRGNHELWRHHSVFTQLRGVSIPQGAPQFNCSTGAHTPARAARAGAWERPPGVFPGGRSCWARGPLPGAGPVAGMRFPLRELSYPVLAASTASAAAPSPAGRRPASAGRAAAAGVARGVPGGGRVAGPPAPAAAAVAVVVPASAAAPRAGQEPSDHQGAEHDQDDADDHGVLLLPLPGLAPGVPPKQPPVGRLAFRMKLVA